MTQKLLPLLILFLAFGSLSYGQRNCNAMEYLDQQIQDNPQRLIQLQEIEKFTQKFIKNTDQKVGELLTIPVVVHVVYNTGAENISDSQINSQIQILNDDFRRLNADADGTWPQAADTEIEFCLATQDPSGASTNGITRTSTSVSSFSANDNMKFNSSGGKDAWPASDYLNFWVCDLSGGLLGYAQFPGGSASTDGVVCDYQYVGNEGTATAPFDLGRTATHEVGHWLNLRHIWGDGGCGVDDFVSDTPLSDASNGGCATGHVSCGTVDMVQNYMDYSDDACMNLFTVGQRDRMQALFAPGGARASLLNSAGCGGGGGGPGPCEDTEITLTLNFDNYPEETTWDIKDAGGSTVAAGGPYGSQPDGSTLLIDICLADACYDFTIYDSYGDGICCGYGNGSYSLDNGGTNLASGGSFGSSETTNFCLGGGGPDTEAPTTPGNLTSSNTTQTSTDLSWNASSDNVGVTGYNVYVDGSLDGTTTGTSYNVSGLTANTTYTMGVQAYDAAGNTSAQATVNVTTQSAGGGTDVILAHYFESGWDGWQDGGSDCYRYNGSRSWEGTRSIRLRDNSGTKSSMTSSSYDVSSYNTLDIEFYFYAWSMENGEDFWVQYHDGSSWNTVATYARGTSFNNNTFYVATVTISDANYNFPSNAKFRFRCDASSNADHVYIDAITITGTSGGARLAEAGPIQTIERMGGLNESGAQFEEDFMVHPNPASDILNITADEDIKSLQVYTITGLLVMDLKNLESHTQIDISTLKSGLYMINLETEEEVMSQKFVKQ